MSTTATKAAFSLIDYEIPEFSFSRLKKDIADINLSFEPSGIYYEKEGKFNLYIDLVGSYENSANSNETLIKITTMATFQFTEKLKFNELPAYFYQNSIAIIFPYIRAFATTLTAVANVTPLIMSTMNLSLLEEPLRKATKVAED